MKFENTEVFNFEGALRGMRNAMESWDKSDSDWFGYCPENNKWVKDCCYYDDCMVACLKNEEFKIGDNDMELAQKLIRAGAEHRKWMRQVFVSVDITAPLFWWKQADQYRIGVTTNSCSTMHKLVSTPITKDCFELQGFTDVSLEDMNINSEGASLASYWSGLIATLEYLRQQYQKTECKMYWKELIRLLPESWLQKRTVTMNYENVLNMYVQRRNHKLNEWSGKDDPTKPNFCSWVLELPYAKQFFIENK